MEREKLAKERESSETTTREESSWSKVDSIQLSILSLFPDYFSTPLQSSILRRAREKGLLSLSLVDIRQFAQGKQRQVDDTPYGGGAGMVMRAGPIVSALRATCSGERQDHWVTYLSPQGSLLNAKRARALAKKARTCSLVFLCGHYGGVDERVLDYIDQEISIGDYVLTSGCAAALVLLEATLRFWPGVLGNEQSVAEDCFEGSKVLDHPHYTRPRIFEGKSVPKVLLSGNHEEIASWRQARAREKTEKVRPDLL